MQRVRGGGAQTQFRFARAYGEAGIAAFDEECGEVAVAVASRRIGGGRRRERGIGPREHEEQAGVVGARHPRLRPVQHETALGARRARAERERIGPGVRLRERERAPECPGDLRKQPPALFAVAEVVQRAGDQRVVDVHEQGHRRVDPGDGLHREHHAEKVGAAAAELLRDGDPEKAVLGEQRDERVGDPPLALHLVRERRDLVAGDLVTRPEVQPFVGVENGDRIRVAARRDRLDLGLGRLKRL